VQEVGKEQYSLLNRCPGSTYPEGSTYIVRQDFMHRVDISHPSWPSLLSVRTEMLLRIPGMLHRTKGWESIQLLLLRDKCYYLDTVETLAGMNKAILCGKK
jgi:hypothetical protein